MLGRRDVQGGGASGAQTERAGGLSPSPRAAALVRGARAGRLPGAPGPSDHPVERSSFEVGLFPTSEPSHFASLTPVAQGELFSKVYSFIRQTVPRPSLLALGNINNNKIASS